MYPKSIRRNATRQQAAIFSQIKSAQFFDHHHNYVGQEFTGFDCIENYYKQCDKATLTQLSEYEFTLRISSQTWINFSTKEEEAIAPTPAPVEIQQEVAKPELKIVPQSVETKEEIAPVETTQETEEVIATMQEELSVVQVELGKCWDVINALEDYRSSFTGLEKILNEALTKSIWARIDDMETKVKQLTAKIATAKENQKAQIISIDLEQWEGRGELESVTVTTWQEANAVLARWASFIDNNSYYKCGILFTFSDSQQFQKRFELSRDHAHKINLAQEVMTELKFMSGDRPSHMSEKDYQGYLKMCKVDTTKYQQLIQNWEIPA